jgi:Glycogen recognition site of AMP-activated protein kinase
MREHDDEIIEQVGDELRGPVPVSASFDARVMRAVRAIPRHTVLSRPGIWARITAPRPIVVRPLSVGLIAACLLALAGVGVLQIAQRVAAAAQSAPSTGLASTAKPVGTQRVQFVLVAPDAKKVAVVGDFNGWDASHAAYQAKHRGGGVWSVTAPVPVGHHRYSFVVDDSVWMADPTAPRAADNDFGLPNSAIVVEADK